jgi:hypothetical protein
MKLILLLSVLCGSFQLGSAVNTANMDEFASQVYHSAIEKVGSFFKTAGTPVTNSVRPSLRTESGGLHERATAHFTFYKDAVCTELNFVIDFKIGRCFSFLGNSQLFMNAEDSTGWDILTMPYDATCTIPQGSPDFTHYSKKTCTDFGNGDYIKFDIIAHPLRSVEGGGGALVFYDDQYDCQVSKHTNLARAQVMITFPTDVCAASSAQQYFTPTKAISCDATSMKFNIYPGDFTCSPGSAVALEIPTSPAIFSCTSIPVALAFLPPYQVLCIDDSTVVMNT